MQIDTNQQITVMIVSYSACVHGVNSKVKKILFY